MGDQLGASVQFDLKPNVWFVNRRLPYKPLHFVTAKTPLTMQSALWIINTLSGRFTFDGYVELDELLEEVTLPSFEDPVEATVYELKWS